MIQYNNIFTFCSENSKINLYYNIKKIFLKIIKYEK